MWADVTLGEIKNPPILINFNSLFLSCGAIAEWYTYSEQKCKIKYLNFCCNMIWWWRWGGGRGELWQQFVKWSWLRRCVWGAASPRGRSFLSAWRGKAKILLKCVFSNFPLFSKWKRQRIMIFPASANGHPEGPASCKWWSGGTSLLQSWSSGGAALLQMII